MKNSFKKAISVLLVFILAMGVLPVAANATVTDTYVIRFWLDEEKTVAYGEELTYEMGDEVIFPEDPSDSDLVNPGTYFDCWDGDVIDVIDQDTAETYFVEENGVYYYDLVAITADYEYTVSFYLSGLSWQDESEPYTAIEGMLYGDCIYEEDLPETEFDGVEFKGWSYNGAELEIPFEITGNADIFGEFEALYYNAVFDANGGKWADDSGEYTLDTVTVPVAYEGQIEAPAALPYREGYSLDPEMPWDPELGIMDIEDQYFYANWIANKYKITFSVNGENTETVQTFGKKIALPSGISTEKAGYVFKGWSIDGTNVIENFTDMSVPAEDTTYTAVFEPDPNGVEYTVNKYFMNVSGNYDGVEPETKKLNALAGTVVTYNDEEFEGFTLDTSSGNLSETVNGNGTTVINAYYLRNKVNVTLDGNTKQYYYGETVAQPENPEKEGYEFLGWEYEGGESVVFPVTVGNSDINIVAKWEKIHIHTPVTERTEPDCKNDGKIYVYCEECKEPISTEILPSEGHTPGDEWITVTEPTLNAEGEKIKKCTVCGETAESQPIASLEDVEDSSGIIIVYSPDEFNGNVAFEIEKTSAQQAVNNTLGLSKSTSYDIELSVDGKPCENGSFEVSIPVPEDYGESLVKAYFINPETNAAELVDSKVENGFIIFNASKSGVYSVAEKYMGTFEIRKPSRTAVNYGDAIILHADLSEDLPEGAYIEWSSDNGNFKMEVSEDGLTCKITPDKNGTATITAKVYDSNGNEAFSDDQQMNSKAGIFQKIIAFFKRLFGLTKTYTEAIFIK